MQIDNEEILKTFREENMDLFKTIEYDNASQVTQYIYFKKSTEFVYKEIKSIKIKRIVNNS